MNYPTPMDVAEAEDAAADALDAALDWPYSREVWDQIDAERVELLAANDGMAERLAEAERDAARYRYMRGNASFRDRNGPGLYWYLPRFLPGGSAEQLDASIDASITADSASDALP